MALREMSKTSLEDQVYIKVPAISLTGRSIFFSSPSFQLLLKSRSSGTDKEIGGR